MKSQFSQIIRFKFHHPLKNNWLLLFDGTKSLSNICLTLLKTPLWWTNDYPLNAMGQIVHIPMIPIFRRCHAVVSTNPMLWRILNLAHLVLRMGLNTACGGILYEQKKSTHRRLYGAEPNASSRSITQHVFWLDNMRSHVVLYFGQEIASYVSFFFLRSK